MKLQNDIIDRLEFNSKVKHECDWVKININYRFLP